MTLPQVFQLDYPFPIWMASMVDRLEVAPNSMTNLLDSYWVQLLRKDCRLPLNDCELAVSCLLIRRKV